MVAEPTDTLTPGMVPTVPISSESDSNSRSVGTLTPDAQARLNAGRAIDQTAATGLEDTIKKAGDVAAQKAIVDQEKANREAAVTAEYNQRRLAALDNAQKDYAAAQAAHKQAFDDYRKMDVTDFFSDKNPKTGETTKNTGRLIMAAITVGLGGLTQRYNGGTNTALVQLNKTMDDYFARQRDAILKAKDIANEAKGNIGEVAVRQNAALKNIDIKEAAARAAVADEMTVKLANLGVPEAQIATNRAVLEQQQKAAAKLQQIDESERAHIVATHTKSLTEPHATGGTTPTKLTDSLTGKDLPVDPTRTDARQHNAAVDKLTATNTMIETGLKILSDFDKHGLYSPELVDSATGRGKAAPQGARNADVIRLRSAYPASRGESVSAENSKHIENALPDAPSAANLLPGAGATWRAKVQALVDENISRRDALLSAAGVAPEAIPQIAPAEIAKRQGARGAGLEAAPAARPATAAPARAATPAPTGSQLSAPDRAKLMLHLKRNPNDPRAPEIRAALGM